MRPRDRLVPIFASAFAASLVAASSASRAAEPIGQVTQVAGRPAVQDVGAKRVLTAGANVAARETIVTDGSGKAVLRFADNTGLSVGANATVKVENFALAPAAFSIRATRGALRLAPGRNDPNTYRIETPAATIGVQGGQVDVRVDGTGVRVSVIDGSATLCPQRGRPNFADCVEAAAGQTVESTATKAKIAATASLPPLRAGLLPLTAVAGAPGGVLSGPVQAVGGAVSAVSGVAGAVNGVTMKVMGTTGKIGGAVLNGTVGEVARPLSGTDPDEPAMVRPRED